MPETTYCLLWNAKLRKPIDVMSVEQARARDAATRAGRGEDQYDYLAVWFVDDDGRRFVEFGFTKQSAEQMFLTDFVRWQYPPGARADFRDAELIEGSRTRPTGSSGTA